MLIDADVHNYTNSIDDLLPYVSERWRVYIKQGGFQLPGASLYPKVFAQAARRDSIPPNGKTAGGNPGFSRVQLLEKWKIDYGILNPLLGVSQIKNQDLANAMMFASNEWTREVWLDDDPRWLGSIVVNINDPEASAREIRRVAKDPRFVQVLLLARSRAPYGRREFDPIFRAAAETNLPVGIHFGGGGDVPITAVGWPSYYIEDHTGMAQAFEGQVISLVCEGVFEKYPGLNVVLIEGGFAWLPALMWRLDKNYRGLHSEVPWLTKLPSAYIREHFRATTQPMEEPEKPEQLGQVLDMIGKDDFLMFSTDYPHWDFDAPDRAIPNTIAGDLREGIMWRNAMEFYGLKSSH